REFRKLAPFCCSPSNQSRSEIRARHTRSEIRWLFSLASSGLRVDRGTGGVGSDTHRLSSIGHDWGQNPYNNRTRTTTFESALCPCLESALATPHRRPKDDP